MSKVAGIYAFNQGRDARREGVNAQANPYPVETIAHANWQIGWQIANKEITALERPLDPKLHAAPEPRPKRDDT